MRLSPPQRVSDYRAKAWWRGETIDEIFRRAVAARGLHEALIDPPNRASLDGRAPRRLTYDQLDAEVSAMASAFAALGVGRDDVITTQLPNVVEGVIAFLACARLGAILSPAAIAYRAHELRHIFASVSPKLFLTVTSFHGHDHAATALQLKAQGLTSTEVVCLGAEAPEGAHALDALLSAHAGETVSPPSDLDAADIVTVCWTSGTEAFPKGVPRSHDHWTATGEVMLEVLGIGPDDTVLNPFPLINISAFGGMVLPWLMAQGRLVQHHPLDLEVLIGQLEQEKVSYTVIPPAVLNMMIKDERRLAGVDLSKLRRLGSGSAPLAPWMVRGWKDRFGVEVVNFFGSNEGASLPASSETVPDPELRCQVFPRFGVESLSWSVRFASKMRTRLVDPGTEEEITEPGRQGEMRIDGPTVFDGYWNAPDLSKAAFDDQGFFKTGDLFEIAPEGDGRFYRFVGRCKEIIIRGGQNISPAELDPLIESHPKVREASCAAYADERLGERVCAVVVPQPGETITLDELITHLRDIGVAVYKLPERLMVVEALPRNAVGKVLRRDLTARLAAEDRGEG